MTTDEDYAIYEGSLDDFYSHEPKVCSTEGATTMTIEPGAGSRYYLVVPRNELREGSYGRRSNGAEVAQCMGQGVKRNPLALGGATGRATGGLSIRS